jgi:hypothetical protein
MNCHNCEKEIKPGEQYYCWTFSVERLQGSRVTVEKAMVTRLHCLKCGPGDQADTLNDINAQMN